MAKEYTAAEIMAMSPAQLPGFTGDCTVTEALSLKHPTGGDISLWQPVLSATVVRWTNGEPSILDAIRDANSNTVHGDIVSTPTIRIPY